jgi:glycosyltransferase involved in cell wall biosynthesis
MMKLSVVIITKNEERIIARCLESVKWAGEIVVVDSGSSDDTLNIAKRHGARIYKKKWEGYAKQKNFGISKAKYPWVLSLDADEIITPELKDEITGILGSEDPAAGNKAAAALRAPSSSAHPEIAGYFMPRKTYFYGHLMRFGGVYPDYQMRLFKRSKGRFKETDIHEGLIVDGAAGHLKNPALHYSKADIMAHIDTINSYTELEMKKAEKSGYTPTGYSVFIKPSFNFIKYFIFKSGFLDGIYGFIFWSVNSMYIFLREVKIMELKGLDSSNLSSTVFKRAR